MQTAKLLEIEDELYTGSQKHYPEDKDKEWRLEEQLSGGLKYFFLMNH